MWIICSKRIPFSAAVSTKPKRGMARALRTGACGNRWSNAKWDAKQNIVCPMWACEMKWMEEPPPLGVALGPHHPTRVQTILMNKNPSCGNTSCKLTGRYTKHTRDFLEHLESLSRTRLNLCLLWRCLEVISKDSGGACKRFLFIRPPTPVVCEKNNQSDWIDKESIKLQQLGCVESFLNDEIWWWKIKGVIT